jgi:hypothetical protein
MTKNERNDLIQSLAAHYENRALQLEETARRYGHLRYVDMDILKAQAMAMREAACYAHQQKDAL